MSSQQFCAQSIVREFTLGAANAVFEDGASMNNRNNTLIFSERPILSQPEQVKFIAKMVLSEVLEMLLTVSPNVETVKDMLHKMIDTLDLPTSSIPNIHQLKKVTDESGDKVAQGDNDNGENKYVEAVDVIEAQMDAVADIMYYLLDFCTKQGYNMDRIMDCVHGANMAKRQEDGHFHKRADGKVIKPKGWKEADLKTEVLNQILKGSWHLKK